MMISRMFCFVLVLIIIFLYVSTCGCYDNNEITLGKDEVINPLINNTTFNYKCFATSGSDRAVIEPRGDIYREVNASFPISCHINPRYSLQSDGFIFTKGLNDLKPLDAERVDDYTLRLRIYETKPIKYKIVCRDLNKTNYCVREVAIGYSPLDVENFRCVSFNWTRLECAYDVQPNPVQGDDDDYFLAYSSEDTPDKLISGYKCSKTRRRTCCHLDGDECWIWNTSDYFYDKFSQFLNFTVYSKNALGSAYYSHIINQYETMIPSPALNLGATSKEPFFIVVRWDLPVFLTLFDPGITYKVKYETLGIKKFITNKIFHQKSISLPIRVQWPGQTYAVTVLLRSGNNSWDANDDEDEWWSNPVSVIVATPPLPPWKAPAATPGIFQVSNQELKEFRIISVAWRKLEDQFKGGPGFKYGVSVFADGKMLGKQPHLITETFAEFEGMSTSIQYEFYITPENEQGKANETSRIVVGREADLPQDIFFPLVIFHPKEEVIELKWFSEKLDGKHYTLFWCNDELTFVNKPCKETLNWKIVHDRQEVNLTKFDFGMENLNDKFRFAISTKNSASSLIPGGMVWASCPLLTYEMQASLMAPTPEVIEKSLSTVTVAWNLRCQHWRGNPIAIEVYWCQGVHSYTTQCSDSLSDDVNNTVFNTVVDVWLGKMLLEGLISNSNYTIWIRIIYKAGNSEMSHPAIITTEESILTWGTIVALSSASALIIVIAIILIFYCQRQVADVWRKIVTSINLPSGLRDPNMSGKEHHLPPVEVLRRHSEQKLNRKKIKMDKCLIDKRETVIKEIQTKENNENNLEIDKLLCKEKRENSIISDCGGIGHLKTTLSVKQKVNTFSTNYSNCSTLIKHRPVQGYILATKSMNKDITNANGEHYFRDNLMHENDNKTIHHLPNHQAHNDFRFLDAPGYEYAMEFNSEEAQVKNNRSDTPTPSFFGERASKVPANGYVTTHFGDPDNSPISRCAPILTTNEGIIPPPFEDIGMILQMQNNEFWLPEFPESYELKYLDLLVEDEAEKSCIIPDEGYAKYIPANILNNLQENEGILSRRNFVIDHNNPDPSCFVSLDSSEDKKEEHALEMQQNSGYTEYNFFKSDFPNEQRCVWKGTEYLSLCNEEANKKNHLKLSTNFSFAANVNYISSFAANSDSNTSLVANDNYNSSFAVNSDINTSFTANADYNSSFAANSDNNSLFAANGDSIPLHYIKVKNGTDTK